MISTIPLSEIHTLLIQYLASNSHDEFCFDLVEDGWRYNSSINETLKLTNILVPYSLLKEKEKIVYIESNTFFIRTVICNYFSKNRF